MPVLKERGMSDLKICLKRINGVKSYMQQVILFAREAITSVRFTLSFIDYIKQYFSS